MKRRISQRKSRWDATEAASVQLLESRTLLTSLSNGQEVLGTVAEGTNQEFDFQVDVGETVRFSVGEIGQTNATPVIEVFDSSGVSVGSDLDGVGVAVQITAESTGTYTAVVAESGDDAAFDFRARVVVLPGENSPGLIADRDRAMANGEEFESTLPSGSFSVFPFEVDTDETVRFSVGEIGQTNATPIIEVFDPSGVSIGSDLDGVGVAVQFTGESTGTYTAIVRESGNDAAFDFRARVVVLPGEDSPGLIADRDKALANGEEFESTLPSGSFSVFPFEVDTDATVRFSVGEIGQTNATPIVEVFDPSGVSVGSDLDGVGVAVQITTESTGTYTAIVRESGNDAAFNFRARVVVLPGQDSPGLIADRDKALANGEEFESTLPSGSFSVFPFEAGSDETVRFSVGEIGQTNATPIIEVFDPSGVSVGSDLDGVGAAVQITAESTGTYTAIVRESGNDAAFNFRARVVVLPGQDSPGLIADRDKVLANGEEFESTLPSGVFSVFPFGAEANELVRLSVEEIGSTNATPIVEVFDPSGVSIGSDLDGVGVAVEFKAESTGIFTAVIRESGNDAGYAFLAKLEKGDVFIDSAVLNISGTSETDDVLINQLGATTVVTMDTREWTFSNSAFDSINVELLGGDDELSAENVNRAIVVSAGDGDDTVLSGSGDDEIHGDAGDDSLIGGDGDDTLNGGIGNDTIRGNAGDDEIDGGNGNDSVIGGGGDDSIVGGDGIDTLGGSVGNDTVVGGEGNDELGGGSGDDSVLGEGGNDSITGEEGDDTILGGIGNDSIFAASGNDSLDGGSGNDSIFGGGNADTLVGGGGDDTLFGRGGKDIVFGNGGDDSIVGGGGTDTLYGNSGADTLKGGRFADAIVGGPGDDSLNGGDQRDLLIGSDGADSLNGNGQNDILVAGSTTWEDDIARLADVIAEWDSTRAFADRVANLRDGSGTTRANGTTFLSPTTVSNDSDADQLTGEGAKDWFFADLDEILDLAGNELVN